MPTTSRANAILAAVQGIHDAVLVPDGWARALPLIAAAVGSEQGCLLIRTPAMGAAGFVTSFGISQQQMACFASAFASAPPPLAAVLEALPSGSVVVSAATEPDSAFARSTFYNEGVRPSGGFYGMMVSPLRTPQQQVHMGVGRLLGRENYDAEDVATMQVLVPHLVTAMHVGRRLAMAELRAASSAAAFDRVDAGIILLDVAGGVMFANWPAEKLLAEPDGLRIDADGLSAADPAAARALKQMMLGSVAGFSIALGGCEPIAVRREGRAPLRVVAVPLRAVGFAATWFGPVRPATMVLITDPEREGAERNKRLRLRFELTAAEADVALQIAEGGGRQAAAARLGVAVSTVRAHLSRIFEKTGVHRQAELVRLVLQEAPTP